MTENASLTSSAAGRYATALFDLAKEEGVLETVEQDLISLGQALKDSTDLSHMIDSPIYSRDQQGRALTAVAEAMGLSALTKNVMGLMAQNRRSFALPKLIATYLALMAEHRGEVSANVTAARPLSDAQVSALSEKLRAAVGKDVKLDVTVDENIIGGLIVKVGSKMIDSSIRSKLAGLQNAMKEVG